MYEVTSGRKHRGRKGYITSEAAGFCVLEFADDGKRDVFLPECLLKIDDSCAPVSIDKKEGRVTLSCVCCKVEGEVTKELYNISYRTGTKQWRCKSCRQLRIRPQAPPDEILTEMYFDNEYSIKEIAAYFKLPLGWATEFTKGAVGRYGFNMRTNAESLALSHRKRGKQAKMPLTRKST